MTKRKMPVKTATLDFADDGYEGFTCETWMNIPVAYTRRCSGVDGKDDEETTDLFLKLFPAWDFVDFEGKRIPHTSEGTDLIPADLSLAMMRHRAEALRNGAMPAPLEESLSDAPSGLAEASKPLKTT